MNEQQKHMYELYYPLLHPIIKKDIDNNVKNEIDAIFYDRHKNDAFSKFKIIFPTLTPNQLMSFNPLPHASPDLNSYIVLYSGGFGNGIYCRSIFVIQNKQYIYQEGPSLHEGLAPLCNKRKSDEISMPKHNIFNMLQNEPIYVWRNVCESEDWTVIYRFVISRHFRFMHKHFLTKK